MVLGDYRIRSVVKGQRELPITLNTHISMLDVQESQLKNNIRLCNAIPILKVICDVLRHHKAPYIMDSWKVKGWVKEKHWSLTTHTSQHFLIKSVFLSFCLSVFLSFCLSVFLSFCLSVFLSFCLSVFMSLCLSVFLSLCL